MSEIITKLMTKALDRGTISKYCLPSIVMLSSNRIEDSGNILVLKKSGSLQLQGQRKTQYF